MESPMIIKKADIPFEYKENMQGGNGSIRVESLLPNPPEHLRLMGYLELKPGDSVGSHSHENESEIYYIVEGELVLSEGGVEERLQRGDVHYFNTPKLSHSIRNDSGKDASFIAVIIKD
jgi:quercetin dioxygenase-like cupin family protein